ncbi:hypothetical protein GCM10010388_55420 [Streptomyces mauvecolor]
MELLPLLGKALVANLDRPIGGNAGLLMDVDVADAARLHHTAVPEAAYPNVPDLVLRSAVIVSNGPHLSPLFIAPDTTPIPSRIGAVRAGIRMRSSAVASR